MSIYIYIYVYKPYHVILYNIIHNHKTHILHIYLSLSLSIYIYIYYSHNQHQTQPQRCQHCATRKTILPPLTSSLILLLLGSCGLLTTSWTFLRSQTRKSILHNGQSGSERVAASPPLLNCRSRSSRTLRRKLSTSILTFLH